MPGGSEGGVAKRGRGGGEGGGRWRGGGGLWGALGLGAEPRLDHGEQVLGALHLRELRERLGPPQLAVLDVGRVGGPGLEPVEDVSGVDDGRSSLRTEKRRDSVAGGCGRGSAAAEKPTWSHSSLKKSRTSILVTTSRSTVISSSSRTCGDCGFRAATGVGDSEKWRRGEEAC